MHIGTMNRGLLHAYRYNEQRTLAGLADPRHAANRWPRENAAEVTELFSQGASVEKAEVFSFGHTCLKGHYLAGEESFGVEWHHSDDSVWCVTSPMTCTSSCSRRFKWEVVTRSCPCFQSTHLTLKFGELTFTLRMLSLQAQTFGLIKGECCCAGSPSVQSLGRRILWPWCFSL